MQLDRLGLHSHILPQLKDIAKTNGNAQDTINDCLAAEIFDCRSLPLNFVAETGDAMFDEMKAIVGSQVRLPYPKCYFEFADEISVLAIEHPAYAVAELGDADKMSLAEAEAVAAALREKWDKGEDLPEQIGVTVQIQAFFMWTDWERDGSLEQRIADSYGEFDNNNNEDGSEEYESPFFEIFGDFDLEKEKTTVEWGKSIQIMGGRSLIGVLSLLADKLISSEHVPDPAPKLTKAREKHGRLPMTSARHVLTVNVAAIREQVRKNPVGTHESPMLHWRRGHWRIVHRGSEFENKTWIKKCLVGDPSRGFAAKQYRLVKEQPLMGKAS